MNLTLTRDTFTTKSTTGILQAGKWTCFTLEDRVREGPKVPGETAIPYGLYEVIISFSARFKRPLPLLLNVPGFEGIRIHPGNTDKDTEGCILVGQTRSANFIGGSKAAFGELFPLLQAAAEIEKVYIQIKGVE